MCNLYAVRKSAAEVAGHFQADQPALFNAADEVSCYPSEEWSPLSFDEAERYRTIHYRQAVNAAQDARGVLTDPSVQHDLFASPQS